MGGTLNIPIPDEGLPLPFCGGVKHRLPVGHNPHDRYWGLGDSWELKQNIVDINAGLGYQQQSYRYQHQQDSGENALAEYKAGLANLAALQAGDVRGDWLASRSNERSLWTLMMTNAATTSKAYDTWNLTVLAYFLDALAKLDNDSLEAALRNNPEMVEALGKAFSTYAPFYHYAYPYPPAQAAQPTS